MGVTTNIKIKNIIIGAIICPIFSPNLIQVLLNGVKMFGLNIAIAKIAAAIDNDQILIGFPFKSGHKPIIAKTTKKRMPKLFFR